jgi:adenine-specific DNA methylase
MQKEVNLLENIFLSYRDFSEALKTKAKDCYRDDLLEIFIAKALIIGYEKKNELYFLREEIDVCQKLMRFNYEHSDLDYEFVGYSGTLFSNFIKIGEGTYISYSEQDSTKRVPVLVKNILYFFMDKYEKGEEHRYEFKGVIVNTDNTFVSEYVSNAIYRAYKIDTIKKSNFASSSCYMGSKKDIVGFLIESVWPHCKDDSCILDIMCGSGAASNAFAQIGKVYASDAQEFCILLAKVQGKGFNVLMAEKLLMELHPHYLENLKNVQKRCAGALIKEDELFHMDTQNRDILMKKYDEMVATHHLYSSTEKKMKNIEALIGKYKKNPKKTPYCLFTYYYANVYFGIEQCNQIDSIRYAIDSLQNTDYNEWLLGVLVIAVSSIASNYGGHFAQPKKVDNRSICSIIEERKRSVWLEFSKRLLSIAAESERYSNEIIPICGPWENALNEMKRKKDDNLIVYLDAPYKREAYSRYYHVLETVVKYDYPSSELKGHMRSIQKGERFKSVFSSRNIELVEKYFVAVIISILSVSNVCAWSYSTNGTANIMHVINEVCQKVPCRIFLYGIPHKHVAQGKQAKKSGEKMKVIEYCIVFTVI